MTPTALITGGHTGIGLGIAQALAGAGFRLALAAQGDGDAPEVPAALAELRATGAEARYYHHDVTDIDRVPALLDAIEADLGPVTTLVSNAGISTRRRGDLLDLEPGSYDAVMAVNLRGAFFLAQQVARRMIALPDGAYRSIIFVTSVSARMASPERADYCISKSGAAMMTALFAARLAPEGIGVFELRPGIIATGMTAGVRDKYDRRIAEGLVPARRWGQPADIGAALLPLATGQLAFSTGATIPVDGGLSIARL